MVLLLFRYKGKAPIISDLITYLNRGCPCSRQDRNTTQIHRWLIPILLGYVHFYSFNSKGDHKRIEFVSNGALNTVQ